MPSQEKVTFKMVGIFVAFLLAFAPALPGAALCGGEEVAQFLVSSPAPCTYKVKKEPSKFWS